jgi:hypothetical protein
MSGGAQPPTESKPVDEKQPTDQLPSKQDPEAKAKALDDLFAETTKNWNVDYPEALKKKLSKILDIMSKDKEGAEHAATDKDWATKLENWTGNSPFFCSNLVKHLKTLGMLSADPSNPDLLEFSLESKKSTAKEPFDYTKHNDYKPGSTGYVVLQAFSGDSSIFPCGQIPLIKALRQYTYDHLWDGKPNSSPMLLIEAKDAIEKAISDGVFVENANGLYELNAKSLPEKAPKKPKLLHDLTTSTGLSGALSEIATKHTTDPDQQASIYKDLVKTLAIGNVASLNPKMLSDLHKAGIVTKGVSGLHWLSDANLKNTSYELYEALKKENSEDFGPDVFSEEGTEDNVEPAEVPTPKAVSSPAYLKSALNQMGWSSDGKGSLLLSSMESPKTVGDLVDALAKAGKTAPKGLVTSLLDDLLAKGFVKEKGGKFSLAVSDPKPFTELPKELPKIGKNCYGLHKSVDQVSLGGSKDKTILEDANGATYLFKSGDKPALAAESVSNVMQKIMPDLAVPVKASKFDKSMGSVQPLLKSKKVNSVNSLSAQQKLDLVKHQVLDWAVGNYDNKPDQFINFQGRLLGIDKDQSVKNFLAVTELKVDQGHTGSGSIYKQWNNHLKTNPKQLKLETYKEMIDKIDSIPDEEWAGYFAKSTSDPLLKDQLLARKHSLRSDFEKLLSEIKGEPVSISGGAAVVTPPAVLKSPGGVATVTSSSQVPSKATLTLVGSGKHLGGAKDKSIYKDKQGNEYLYKPASETWRKFIQQGVSDLTEKIVGPGEFIPVKADEGGTIQPLLKGVTDLSNPAPSSLTPQEVKGLQKERVLDWVFGNHDSHGGNLLKANGTILGIDKEQALKHIGSDQLSTTYHPNEKFGEKPPYYNTFYEAYANKKINLDPNDMLPYIEKIEAIPDSTWEQALKPYVESLAESLPNVGVKWKQTKMKQILDRKHNVRKDFEKFFTDLKKKRGEGPFTFGK